jgi:hypothetical protein
MLVLVGCEESGVVRDAFLRRGHEAYSNDFEPARNGGPHIQDDVMKALYWKEWDLIILHPECKFMCVSGNRHYGRGTPKNYLRQKALQWTELLWRAAKQRARVGVAMENPMSTLWRYIAVVPQYIQPYQFGHPETKKTGLALDRLTPLVETNNVYDQMVLLPKKDRNRIHYMSPGANRSRDRSVTYSGIAAAMAEQWG